MTPFNPTSDAQVLGGIPLGGLGLALSAVAQFGIYWEARQMRRLNEAAFEERRHAWIDDISDQWIEEHKSSIGVQREITSAVSLECRKMWEKLCVNEAIDVPQSLLLKISRMNEFLETNYRLAASASNSVADASDSIRRWRLDPSIKTQDIVKEILADAIKESKGEWWKGLLKVAGGVPLLIVPGVGPFAGGGAIGYGAAEMFRCLTTSDTDYEHLEDKLPLLQFGIAAELLDRTTRVLRHLLDQQEFENPARFVISEMDSNRIEFALIPTEKPGLFRKTKFNLKPIPYPDSEA